MLSAGCSRCSSHGSVQECGRQACRRSGKGHPVLHFGSGYFVFDAVTDFRRWLKLSSQLYGSTSCGQRRWGWPGAVLRCPVPGRQLQPVAVVVMGIGGRFSDLELDLS
jgi:hypothetical protein